MTKEYIGVKLVTAWPQAKQLGPGEEATEGYAVKYEDGYTSWSPKDVFENAYKPIDEIRANSFTWEFLGTGVRVVADGADCEYLDEGLYGPA